MENRFIVFYKNAFDIGNLITIVGAFDNPVSAVDALYKYRGSNYQWDEETGYVFDFINLRTIYTAY